MVNLKDFIASVGNLTRLYNVLEENQKRQDVAVEKIANEISALRKEVAGLSERVAVLEEGRKTIAEQVNSAIVKALADAAVNQAKEEAARTREENERLRRQIEGSK